VNLPALDRRAVLTGAVVAAVVVLPAAFLNNAAAPARDSGDDASWVVYLAFLLILGGLVLGGFVAGRLQPNTPLVHGAAAAALTYLVIQGAFAVRRAIVDEPVSWLGIVFLTLLAASCGMGGGLVASWRHSRHLDRTQEG
jgi:putative membrane protein (TIGR04086 family)